MRAGLRAFLEAEIVPRYGAFDPAHDETHARRVMQLAETLAAETGADAEIALTAAAYHDLGLCEGRAVHHLVSGAIVRADGRLKKWFSDDEIEEIAQAVEDHRASASTPPRGRYGVLLAEADRDLDPESVMRRTVEYGIAHYGHLDKAAQYLRYEAHLREKYMEGGYLKLLTPTPGATARLARLRAALADDTLRRAAFETAWKNASTKTSGD